MMMSVMRKYKETIIQIVQWIMAVIVAAIICNTFLFVYHRPTGWIDRDKGATNSIWDPGTWIVWGTEGRSIRQVDRNGYLNEDKELSEDGYVLVVGTSHTQGKEVGKGKRYTDILNEYMMRSTEKLEVYNCSQDSYYFPKVAKGFVAINEEFKDAKSIIIEMGSVEWKVSELENALSQREYDFMQNGSVIKDVLPKSKLISLKIKEWFPIYSNIKVQFENKRNAETDNVADTISENESDYEKAVDRVLNLMCTEFDGQLIIMYHPSVQITENGMQIKYEDKLKEFENLCKDNDIIFVDMSEEFIDAYKSEYSVPYGFNNTTMGNGHLNVKGHKIIADKLYDVLKENVN